MDRPPARLRHVSSDLLRGAPRPLPGHGARDGRRPRRGPHARDRGAVARRDNVAALLEGAAPGHRPLGARGDAARDRLLLAGGPRGRDVRRGPRDATSWAPSPTASRLPSCSRRPASCRPRRSRSSWPSIASTTGSRTGAADQGRSRVSQLAVQFLRTRALAPPGAFIYRGVGARPFLECGLLSPGRRRKRR